MIKGIAAIAIQPLNWAVNVWFPDEKGKKVIEDKYEKIKTRRKTRNMTVLSD